MRAMNTEKRFDCIEFKRKAQEQIHEETKGLKPEGEIAYFNRAARTGPLGDWWKTLRSS